MNYIIDIVSTTYEWQWRMTGKLVLRAQSPSSAIKISSAMYICSRQWTNTIPVTQVGQLKQWYIFVSQDGIQLNRIMI